MPLLHCNLNLNVKQTLSFPLPQLINAAANRDREAVLRQSRHMKFLTGFESKVKVQSVTKALN